MLVDVCVCTFRRAHLAQTLESIAGQHLPSNIDVRVIVADNDSSPSAMPLVREVCGRLNLQYLYVHAPYRNIAVARNACLDQSTAQLVAFLDDDEVAVPTWLAALLAHLEATEAEVVFGPVKAEYGSATAQWVRAVDLHSTFPVIHSDGSIRTGYTGNVIMRRSALRDLHFETDLGRSGGEDTVFFDRLYRSGASLQFCPTAIVYEEIARNKQNMAWLLRRFFRYGQTHGRLLQMRGRQHLHALPLAAGKVAFCLLLTLGTLASARRWRRNLVRASLHCGVVSYLLGKRELELYTGAHG